LGLESRLEKVRKSLSSLDIDALCVIGEENFYYLTGFYAPLPLLVSPERASVLANPLYLEEARCKVVGFEVIPGDLSSLTQVARDWQAGRLGISESIDLNLWQKLSSQAQEAHLSLVAAPKEVERLREIKEKEEVERLTKAAHMADEAMNYIHSFLKPGMSEKRVAWEAEKFLRENGSGSLPFEVIVASGPNSAFPHALPTDRIIQEGEPVVIDLGARFEGYASDMSRTFFLGRKDEKFSSIYHTVLEAELASFSAIREGMRGDEADKLARETMERREGDKYFIHGLGHGVGISVHEGPTLSPASGSIISSGMVFTLEPGVYIGGWGGIRIEDMVLMEEGKLRALTGLAK
jgi:Xaa-Pro aminopeptidase